MSSRKQGWTGLLKREGADFLAWAREERVLSTKFSLLATALSTLLRGSVPTPEEAHDVWEAVPAVLSRCNEQAAYEKPGAACAYAWLYLLERYVRTWLALERLVQKSCLPMGKHGVRALDVGTGPAPAAFAINDFYSAMVEFSEETDNLKWRQQPRLTCVEIDKSTNHFRHLLAELLFQEAGRESEGVLSLTSALHDFGEFEPTRERKQYFEVLRNEEDEYFDDVAGRWDSNRVYSPDEANNMAQSLHRYRLVAFSNFLTTPGIVKSVRPNLFEVLHDASPGSVVLVLGGRGDRYQEIYDYVDRLANPSGFDLTVESETVSCSDSELAGQVYEQGRLFYEVLQELDHNEDDATETVRRYFERGAPIDFRSSEIRAYRKRRFSNI